MKAIQIIDKLVDFVFGLFLLLCVLYSVYSIWDNNQVFSAVDDIQSDMLRIKPSVSTSDPVVNSFGTGTSGNDFSQLQEINPDICAWLTLDGTAIDFPVVQGNDNEEYLNKDVYGNFATAGSVFLDYRCNNTFDPKYGLIYAHHMGKGKMFGDLDKYHDAEFFRENTTGKLITPNESYDIVTLAVLTTNASDEVIYQPQDYAASADGLVQYVKENAENINDAALMAYEQAPQDYTVLSLTTCAYNYTNARTVVVSLLSKCA